MKLSEIFKNRKQEKKQIFYQLVEYLNELTPKYTELCGMLQEENRKIQKYLTSQYYALQKTCVFQKQEEFEKTNKTASFSQTQKFEEDCLANLDKSYQALKQKTEAIFLEKNKTSLVFIKSYNNKMKEYEKLQAELKLNVPLKKYVPMPCVKNEKEI